MSNENFCGCGNEHAYCGYPRCGLDRPTASSGNSELLCDDVKLCRWLRDNSSGVYRPSVVAAIRIEELLSALQKIASIEDRYNCGDWDEIEEARQIAKAAIRA